LAGIVFLEFANEVSAARKDEAPKEQPKDKPKYQTYNHSSSLRKYLSYAEELSKAPSVSWEDRLLTCSTLLQLEVNRP
jgi:hypothetical protein